MNSRKSLSAGVAFQTLAIITFGNFIESSYSPLSRDIKVHFLINSTLLGLLTSSIFLGLSIMSIFVSYFVDNLGGYRASVIAFALMLTGSAIAFFSYVYSTFVIGYFVIGLGYGIITPATNKIVMDTYFPNHTNPMGLKQSGVPVGAAMGAIAIPVVASKIGFSYPFIFFIAVSIIFMLIIPKNRENPIREKFEFKKYFRNIFETFKNRNFLVFSVLSLFMSWCQQSILTYNILYAVSRGFSQLDAEIMLSFIFIGSFVGRIAWSWISIRFFRNKINAMSAVIFFSSISLYLYFLVPYNFYLFTFISFLLGMNGIGWNGIFVSVVSEMAPKKKIGMYSGLSLMIISSGTIIGTPISGYIETETLNYGYIWIAIGTVVLIISLIMFILSKYEKLKLKVSLN
ncbi:MFS transporter [Caldiplasma sukawensis]